MTKFKAILQQRLNEIY